MNKIKKFYYEFRLGAVKKAIRINGEKMGRLFNEEGKDFNYSYNWIRLVNKRLRLISINSYLENELSNF
ncbi:MAG: hypothetical protein AABX28_00560 [Nanoarchaeota archaeon]